MAGERLPARFSLRSQLWFRWTGKRFETATSHMQTVVGNSIKKEFYLRMKSDLKLFQTLFIILFAYSCHSEHVGKIIIEKDERNGGLRTIVYPDTFDNKESYSIYLEALECVREEDYECTKRLLHKALVLDPENDLLLNDLGLTEMRLFNYDLATEHFKKAIELNSKYYRAYTNLGLNHYYNENYAEGVKILQQVPVDSIGNITKGTLYFHLFMNYTKLTNCDSAYHYYRLTEQTGKNEIFLENVEEFYNSEFKKNCPK